MANGEQDDYADSSPAPVERFENATSSVPAETGEVDANSDAASFTPPVKNSSSETAETLLRDERGRFQPKNEPADRDIVQSAIDRLASDAKPSKAASSAKPAIVTTPEPVAPAAVPTKDDAKLDPLATDPTHDFSDVEKFTLREKTTKRITDLHSRWRKSEDELEQLRPLADSGKEYRGFVETYQLGEDITFVPPDHLAGLVNAQAAVNRAIIATSQGAKPSATDLEYIEHFSSALNATREKLGLAPIGNNSIQPVSGELPEQYKDLIDIYGLDEADVRILAAVKGVKSTDAIVKTDKPTSPVRESARPVVAEAKTEPADNGPNLVELYARRTLATLSKLGVADPGKRIGELLGDAATSKEVMARFPGVSAKEVPRVFNALDPKERMDILIAAHEASTKAVIPVTPVKTVPAQSRTSLRGAPPASLISPHAKGDQVQSAIDYLASDR